MAAVQAALCAAVFPHGSPNGLLCKATRMRVSSVDPAWVFGSVGLYTAQGQPDSDIATLILNLSTHQLIGPTNVGFCVTGQGAPGGGRPIGGYGSLPAAVLTSLSLSPCPPSSTPTASTVSPVPTGSAPTSVTAFAGSWRAHQNLLVISNAGAGHLIYPDLTACPSCSSATAPAGTVDFTLTAVTAGVATGRVTASSDARNWSVGLPVQARLVPGSPGELLGLTLGGKQLNYFCNATSAGQCGA